jgi:hypothetical protein
MNGISDIALDLGPFALDLELEPGTDILQANASNRR